MTSQRWKGAGVVFLGLAVLLIIAAVISALTSPPSVEPAVTQVYPPIVPNPAVSTIAVFRSVVLGAFAGVAFFLGLACFAWSAVVEARDQRSDIISRLTALSARPTRTDDAG